MHRHRQRHNYTCTPTHTDICSERDWEEERQCRKRQCILGTLSAAAPDVDKSSPFSTGIHPQTACPPRRPLALQPTTAHLLPPWWNLNVSLLPPLLNRCIHGTRTQPILIPEKKTRMGGKGDGERHGEMEKDDDRREKKRGERDVPVGS